MAYFIITLSLVALGIIKKKSTGVDICLYFAIFVVSVCFTEGHDLSLYRDGYEQPYVDSDNVEMYRSLFYASFVFILKFLGFSFFQFRIVCFILWSLAALFLIKKYSKYPTFVFSVCTLLPLLANASLIKNGLMVSIVYVAIYQLNKRQNKKGLILYTFLILLAGYMHNTAYCYLLGIIAIGKHFSSGTLLRLSMTSSFILVFLLLSGILRHILLLIVNDYYAEHYFSQLGDFYWPHFHYFIGIFVNLWFSFRAEKIERATIGTTDQYLWEFSRFVKRMNILMILFLPLIIVSVTFWRIYLNLLPLTVISVANASYNYDIKKNNKGKYLKFSFLTYYYSVVFLYNLGQGTFFEFWNSIQL